MWVWMFETVSVLIFHSNDTSGQTLITWDAFVLGILILCQFFALNVVSGFPCGIKRGIE